ncbi:MAG: flagellar basal body P-ring formation chaperone FlgA [Marinobacter sp.]|uniref:flagellar basal body P-ring formation chaperone FlgA n=1 Tax=Marinobacter sp. TaxID=50741 RepID=UPI00299EF7FE|nr:flagellar basal body P-ring formation chaperone FlgA [Marinobacter sp.]MDX1635287.1 flagellar basal body P-ring formation chaperone FlgA [Marinobacter sp.]
MRIFLMLGILALLPLAGHASGTGPDEIRAAAARFLAQFADSQKADGYQVSFEVGTLDSRLKMAACADDLAVEFSGDPWRSTSPRLLVSCDGERPWKLYLTTDLTITGNAYVAARPLNRGDRLNAGMITTAEVVVNAVRRGAVTRKDHLVGMEMQRPVNAGTVFTPDLVTAPDAVSRGDHVIISARSGSFSVQSRGKALANGRIGEQILVENLKSSRTVRGQVVAPGHVEIPM